MPITEELYKILYEDKNLKLSLNDIKKRALKEEDD
jgi:glycerol-3-phosphate dehydrogenase